MKKVNQENIVKGVSFILMLIIVFLFLKIMNILIILVLKRKMIIRRERLRIKATTLIIG